VIFLIPACAEKKELKQAQQKNTVEAYQAFLKNHPHGKNAEKVKIALEKLEWDTATKTNTAGAYDIFLKKYPKSSLVAEAKAALDKLRKPMGKDGALMVLIPEGEFQMGYNDGPDDEKPIHPVYLKAFYMDVYEVTNAIYKKFVDATKYKTPMHWSDPEVNGPNQPVIMVSWEDALEYCKWSGKRLPTEAEWEKSARGGLTGFKYPWGNNLFHDAANYYSTAGKDFWKKTADVGTFAPNGYGLYDVAGNVQEFCSDWYDAKYYASSPQQNPTGPASGKDAVMRGGTWGDELSSDRECGLRVAKRRFIGTYDANQYTGFRCAMNATP
jgi:formylglycine-generating enzyme required for sulfatase activity